MQCTADSNICFSSITDFTREFKKIKLYAFSHGEMLWSEIREMTTKNYVIFTQNKFFRRLLESESRSGKCIGQRNHWFQKFVWVSRKCFKFQCQRKQVKQISIKIRGCLRYCKFNLSKIIYDINKYSSSMHAPIIKL